MELYPEPPAPLGAGHDDDGRVTGQPVPVPTARSLGDRAGEQARARAVQVLAVHRQGLDGWCEGCREAGILAFHPCTSASWASRVLAETPAPMLFSPDVGGG